MAPELAVEGCRSPKPLAGGQEAPPSPGPLLAPWATRVQSDLPEVSLDPVMPRSITRMLPAPTQPQPLGFEQSHPHPLKELPRGQ